MCGLSSIGSEGAMFWAASLAMRAGKFQAFLWAFALYHSILKHDLPALLQTGLEIREMLGKKKPFACGLMALVRQKLPVGGITPTWTA